MSTNDECRNCNVVFDDELEKKHEDILFFRCGRHKNLDEFYLSQQSFEPPFSIRSNRNTINLFKHVAKTVQMQFKNMAGFDEL